MYKEVLRSIHNIEVWPLISVVIFFIFFLALLWWALTAKQAFIKRMSHLPLEDGTPTITDATNQLEV